MAKLKQLGHLVLKVRDVERSEKFYTDVLGLRVTTRRPNNQMVFMSLGDLSHELALLQANTDAPERQDGQIGLFHFAWEMESLEELQILHKELEQKQIKVVRTGDHGISYGLYITDPDGNEIELYWELPKEQWPTEGYLFAGDFPLNVQEEEAVKAD
ncbi:MAG: VOC family protein [Chloroflexi bacterium]|nr:VOC family protein [Chloroflexota bacterium]